MKNKLSILVVDDDEDDHFFFREALESLKVKHDVTSVYNGKQALQYLRDTGKSSDTTGNIPAFIVLDMNMPVLDGIDTIKQIRAIEGLQKVPIYVLTTSRNSAHMDICKQLGCSGYYSKPNRIEELKATVQSMLSSAPQVA